MKRAFGELFDITPMAAQADVDSRKTADGTRAAMVDVRGMWDGPADSKPPIARGSLQDDNAHNWAISFPSVSFFEADLLWVPRRGDKLVRKLDNAVFEVVAPFRNGLGMATLQLSNKARS
ncbi:hypothetical protein [Bradyrhizobium cenepequi]